MKRKAMLSIRGQQCYRDQEPDVIELVTEGTMEFENDGWNISYQESELTGLQGVTTTFRIEQGRVVLIRTGALKSEMIFEQGQSHETLYQLEFGALLMSVRATHLFYDILPEGGSVDLSYEISIENSEAGVIDYHLDIRAVE